MCKTVCMHKHGHFRIQSVTIPTVQNDMSML